VVDAVDLRLVEVGVHLGVQLHRRLNVVAERLLDHHAGVVRETGLGETLDHHPEQDGRDLEVEDWAPHRANRLSDARIGRGVGEVALNVGEPLGEALERVGVDRLAGVLDAAVRMFAQLIDRPVVACHAHYRAVQQSATVEPVQRPKGHHLGQVAGDSEHDEHIGRRARVTCAGCGRRGGLGGGQLLSLPWWLRASQPDSVGARSFASLTLIR
jgi:hypothetical protein